MDYWYPVKEEYAESSSSNSQEMMAAAPFFPAVPVPVPVPMEGLNDTLPPPFLIKTYEMVEDETTDKIVSWSRGGESIVVWDAHAFSNRLLPRHFKHNNFSSFIRQLNTYGFRKIDPNRWEFANELFLKGHKHLLKNITRKKTTTFQPISQQQQQEEAAARGPCVEVGRFGLDGEVDRLRRDKQVLLMELVKLREQQQATRAYLNSVELRIQGTEQRQQHMMSFLAKAMRNPEFLQQLGQHKEERKQLQEAITKKRGRRRRPIDQDEGPSSSSSSPAGLISSIKTESLDYYGNPNYGVFDQESELEALALEIQGFRRRANKEVQEEVEEDRGEPGGGFWDELLNQEDDDGDDDGDEDEEVYNELETLVELDEQEEEDVNVLADRLGFLGSNPK